ncbi:hypothetical protein N656DRAFT_779074, partial [Canariomyces notabilis]
MDMYKQLIIDDPALLSSLIQLTEENIDDTLGKLDKLIKEYESVVNEYLSVLAQLNTMVKEALDDVDDLEQQLALYRDMGRLVEYVLSDSTTESADDRVEVPRSPDQPSTP